MKKEIKLKIFGTGQITIPKQWRDLWGVDELKAVFDEKNKEIKIKPIKKVEIEETKWISAKDLKEDLSEVDLDENFKADLVDAYKNSRFYKAKAKKNV